MDNNIKVAVRVRPFNNREKERNAKCIISVDGKVTTIQNPETGEKKPFTFDFSYWSHCTEDPDYADQSKVFQDLGVTVLENAWNGYNASLFAYGQTGQHKHSHEFLVSLEMSAVPGSGKSYSMVGYGADRGIIPCACEEMFSRVHANTNPEIEFKVEV